MQNEEKKWIIKIIGLTFIITLIFSFISETTMPKVNIFISIFILIVFILIGIIFDMIGVAVTTCDIKPFHSMNAKKIRYAKTAIKLIKNAPKVASICNDMIGDICGIISGSAGIIISSSAANKLNINPFITTLIITSLTASLTIGGKAIGKEKAIKNSTKIIKFFTTTISNFYK